MLLHDLAAVAIAPTHPATRFVDLLGSVMVAGYLLWSGLRMAQSHLGNLRPLVQPRREPPGRILPLPIEKEKD